MSPSSRSVLDRCSHCAVLTGRRAFLADAAAAVAAALLTIAAGPDIAAATAQPLRFTSSTGRSGDKHLYPIPAGDGATIDGDNEVILTRWQGAVYAFSLACPHQNTALRWRAEDARFQCPKHKSKYRPDGTYIEGRATRGMDRFAIRRDGANVEVDLATLYVFPENPEGWTRAFVALATTGPG